MEAARRQMRKIQVMQLRMEWDGCGCSLLVGFFCGLPLHSYTPFLMNLIFLFNSGWTASLFVFLFFPFLVTLILFITAAIYRRTSVFACAEIPIVFICKQVYLYMIPVDHRLHKCGLKPFVGRTTLWVVGAHSHQNFLKTKKKIYPSVCVCVLFSRVVYMVL